MIDRALNFGPPVQQESYYFQLIPVSLSIINKESEVPAKGTTYRFGIFKGMLLFTQSNKNSMRARFQYKLDLPGPAASPRLTFPPAD